MSEREIIKRVEDFAQKSSAKDDIHGFPHVKRVRSMCMKLGKKLNANLEILEIASLLHDVGRIIERTDTKNRNHAELSAVMAEDFLRNLEIILDEEVLENILHCIRAHSFSNNILPRSLEAKILSDSDKLDALGAIGIYRTVGFTVKNSGTLKDVIRHLEEKILTLKSLMYLDISKKIAEKRDALVHQFYYTLKKELSTNSFKS